MTEKKTERLTPKQALLKAAGYCAYQERCHDEVRAKLGEWDVYGNDREEIILQLIRQNYLNEERFAKAFAGGKFRVKNWGRIKITLELKARNVSDYCINKAMKEINDDEYSEVLRELAEEKFRSEKDRNVLVKRNKSARFLIGKGFEPELVWDVLRDFE